MGQAQVLQALAQELFGADHLDDGEAFHEGEEVQHVGAVQAFGQGNGAVAFRVEDVGDAQAFQDAGVGGATGLGDDVLHAQFLQVQHRKEACFQVLADADDDAVRLLQGDGGKLLFAGAVCNHSLGNGTGNVLDLFRVVVDDHDVMTQGGQVSGQEDGGIAKTDNDILLRSHMEKIEKSGLWLARFAIFIL